MEFCQLRQAKAAGAIAANCIAIDVQRRASQSPAFQAGARRMPARGGKLILFHGWSDPAIAPENTVHYYEDVVRTMGQENAGRFVRLFMAPGMQHCGDGPGTCLFGQAGMSSPNDPEHNINLALEQ